MMTPAQQSAALDVIVIVVTLSILAIGLLSMFIGWIVALWDRFIAWWQLGIAQAQADVMSRRIDEEENKEQPENNEKQGSERTDDDGAEVARTPRTTRTPTFGSEPQDTGFVLSSEELIAVQKMIHYAITTSRRGQEPSKSGAIQAGFGLKRGGGPRYIRAALIYDSLLGEPEPAIKFAPLNERKQTV
jgi:hypothetical protein